MSSDGRLSKLFSLMCTVGSAPDVSFARRGAGHRLGEHVQLNGVTQVRPLLRRLRAVLRHSDWDVRVAASHALRDICNAWTQLTPIKHDQSLESSQSESIQLTFAEFNMSSVIAQGRPLLASGGAEYDIDWSTVNPAERLKMQRTMLKQRLGLAEHFERTAVAGELESRATAMVSDADLLADTKRIQRDKPVKTEARAVVDQLSARQKAVQRLALKRSAQSEPRQRDTLNNELVICAIDENELQGLAEDEHPLALCLPFQQFCECLLRDMFDPHWETRHGAVLALRVLFSSLGLALIQTSTHADSSIASPWLEDIAIRLLCLAALDRFVDFVADTSVAPVRETCAQALSTIAQLMNSVTINVVLNSICELCQRDEWDLRHSGFLCLKYVLAVRTDVIAQYMQPLLVPTIFKGLNDTSEDVLSVAALSTSMLIHHGSAAVLEPISEHLWNALRNSCRFDSLTDSDSVSSDIRKSADLATAAASVLDCLTKIELQFPSLTKHFDATVLCPLLANSSIAVRQSAIQLLKGVLTARELSIDEQMVSDLLRSVFQCALIESHVDLSAHFLQVWDLLIHIAEVPHNVGTHILLCQTPTGQQFDKSVLFAPEIARLCEFKMNTSARIRGAQMLSKLILQRWNYQSLKPIALESLQSDWLCRRLFMCLFLSELNSSQNDALNQLAITELIHDALNEPENAHYYFKELRPLIASLQQHTRAFLHAWQGVSDVIDSEISQLLGPSKLESTIELTYIRELLSSKVDDWSLIVPKPATATTAVRAKKKSIYSDPFASASSNKHVGTQPAWLQSSSTQQQRIAELNRSECRQRSAAALELLQSEFQREWARHCSAVSEVIVSSGSLPAKLNPILQALIKSLRIETDAPLQQRAAATLAKVLQLLSNQSNAAAVSKLVKNLLILFHSHRDEVQRQRTQQRELISSGALDPACLTMPLTIDVTLQLAADGAKYVFIECVPFASVENADSIGHLFDHHIAWQLIWQAAAATLLTDSLLTEKCSALSRDLQLLCIIIPSLFSSEDRVAESVFQQLLPLLLKCTSSPDEELRCIAVQCICEIGKRCTSTVMELLVHALHDSNTECSPKHVVDAVQLGQMELIARILSQIPVEQTSAYLILLVSPVLACIGNSKCEESRRLAASSFGILMRLLTVDNAPDVQLSAMSEFSRKLRDQQRYFMDQLTGQNAIDKIKLNFQLARGDINPRDYQMEGISWLRLLHRSHLNGALCDDMGLGKTLQALCAIAASAADQKQSKQKVSHSLIVCPATLLGHWKAEVEHLIPNDLLLCELYSGTSRQRADVLTALSVATTCTVLIVSYDSLRLDIGKLSLLSFDYCVLDEGHQIRNAKAAVSFVAKQIRAAHRLILTGTPIQNEVLELWSLFDFLMPGYLGNESQFQENFSRPILNGHITGASSTAVAASESALANLHAQTLPFLLRRTKEQVLKDLPPKVMQDRICVMSDVQQQLYSSFIESSTALRIVNEQNGDQPTSRALQELMYLRKLCTHPALVLSKEHPEYQRIHQLLDKQNMSIQDIALSPKLLALEQILLDCGIGQVSDTSDVVQPLPAAQHRVLIFAQLRASLDLVVDSLFQTRMPHVKFARIDGSMASADRFSVAQRFQRDLDIDVLLLTTHVGGLGLNLQAADVVVFLEHDFNPMMDLQAADRAHRLGQRRSVHVYRLLMQDTLEERIMNIQRFKAFVAAAVVGDNSGLTPSSMLDVIGNTVSDDTEQQSKRSKPASVDESAMSGEVPATLLGSLNTLWDPKQYDEEFNLDSFVAELSNRK